MCAYFGVRLCTSRLLSDMMLRHLCLSEKSNWLRFLNRMSLAMATWENALLSGALSGTFQRPWVKIRFRVVIP